MTARPYFGSGSRIVCPRQRPAGGPDRRGGAVEHLDQHVAGQVLGECGDRQREEDAATHREDVAHRVRGRDLAERARVVDQWGEEIDGADDREVVADAEHGGIVGRVEAGDQLIGCRLGTKSGEGLGQQIGTELGRTRRNR